VNTAGDPTIHKKIYCRNPAAAEACGPSKRLPMWKRILVAAAGWLLLVLGLAGLFLPVLPGILLVLIGLAVLSSEYHWARRWMTKLREAFPQIDSRLQRFLAKNGKYVPGTNSSGTK
jgi:uncharacterized protein